MLFTAIISAFFLFAASSESDESSESAPRLTSSALRTLREDVRTLILANDVGLTPDSDIVSRWDIVTDSISDYVLIAGILRLVFHDCAGGSMPGKCDGCIDLNDPDNAGMLVSAIGPLSDICDYNNDAYELSYADCWALSATFAIELSGELHNITWDFLSAALENTNPTLQVIFEGDVPYYVGRKDCDTAPDVSEDTIEEYPNNVLPWRFAQQYLKDRFPDMTVKELVALISGGHSVGHAHLRLSGFAGPWGNTNSLIDVDYIKFLTQPIDTFGFPSVWQFGKLNDTFDRKQFHLQVTQEFADAAGLPGPRVNLMLLPDISLYYDFSYYEANGLLDDIDCTPAAITLICPITFPDRPIVLGPGETGEGYDPNLICPAIQCPINCEGGVTTLQNYINNNFDGLDENDDTCIAAILKEFELDEQFFGDTFVSAFTKMITAGYDIQNVDESEDDDNDEDDDNYDDGESGENESEEDEDCSLRIIEI